MADRSARNGLAALALLAAAALAIAWLWPSTLGIPLFGRIVDPLGDATLPTLARLIVFPLAALACLSSAWWFWTAASRRGGAATAMQFGRFAEAPKQERSGAPRLLLPLVAVLLLVGGDFVAFSRPVPAPGEAETAAQSTEPAEPPPGVATEPETPAAPPTPEETPPEADTPAAPESAANVPAAPPAAETPAELPAEQPSAPSAPEEVAVAQPDPPAAEPPPPPESTAPPPPVTPPEAPVTGGHTDGVDWIAVAPNGSTFMTASIDHTVKLWDFAGRRLIRDLGTHKDMARAALYLPGGELALTAGDDAEIVLRRLADAAVLHVFKATEYKDVRGLAISPDGARMVSAHESGAVIVWDLKERRAEHVLTGHQWSVNGIAVSPDGKWAVSGSIDGELRLWDIAEGFQRRQWKGHERGTYGAAFLPDGRLVTGSGDTTVKIWSIPEGRELARMEGHSGTVYAIDVSDDGRTILSGSLDGTARLWDVETATETEQFVVPGGGRVYAAAFGPNGTVLTSGDGGRIRIWPERRGDEVLVMP